MDSADNIGLKDYLTKNFRDCKHKNMSLLDIYREDSAYFKQMKKTNKLRADALIFISENEAELIKAEYIPTAGVRDFIYGKIIDQYLEKISKEDDGLPSEKGEDKKQKKEEPVRKADKENPQLKSPVIGDKASTETKSVGKVDTTKQEAGKAEGKSDQSQKRREATEPVSSRYPRLICPYDLEIIPCGQVKNVRYKHKKAAGFDMPLYKCKACGRRYTSLNQFDDMALVTLNDVQYTNLVALPSKKVQNKRPLASFPAQIKRPCYVYGPDKIKKCGVSGCRHDLININVDAISKKGKHYKQIYRFCPQCGMLYASPAIYDNNQNQLDCRNLDELPVIRAEVKAKAEEKRLKKEEEKRRQEALKAERKAVLPKKPEKYIRMII